MRQTENWQEGRLSPTILIITLNFNDRSFQIKRQIVRLDKRSKNQLYVVCSRHTVSTQTQMIEKEKDAERGPYTHTDLVEFYQCQTKLISGLGV